MARTAASPLRSTLNLISRSPSARAKSKPYELFASSCVEHVGAEYVFRSSFDRRALMPAFVPKQ